MVKRNTNSIVNAVRTAQSIQSSTEAGYMESAHFSLGYNQDPVRVPVPRILIVSAVAIGAMVSNKINS